MRGREVRKPHSSTAKAARELRHDEGRQVSTRPEHEQGARVAGELGAHALGLLQEDTVHGDHEDHQQPVQEQEGAGGGNVQ